MRADGILMGLLTVGLLVSTASAQLVISPIRAASDEKMGAGVTVCYSSIDYTLDETIKNNGTDRWLIGAFLTKGVSDTTEICGSIAWMAKSDPEGDGVDSDGGYILSLGGRMLAFERGLGSVSVYGLGHYITERLKWSDEKFKMFLFEVTAGAVGSYDINPSLTAYAGAELVAYSDGEIRGSDRPDIERDGRITFRGGAMYTFTKFWVRAEADFGSEKGFSLGAGRSF